MEDRPTRWWMVLNVRDGRITAIEDFRRHHDAVRILPAKVAAAP